MSSEPRTFSKGLLFGLLLSASPSCMLSAEGKPLPINDNLEAIAKQLYDYWFVQFDFPNEDGKPYKSSGGAMVWNDKMKREIPQGWGTQNLADCLKLKTERVNSKDIKDTDNYTPIEVIPRKQMSLHETVALENAMSGICRYSRRNILLSNRRVYFHKVCIAPFDGLTRDTVLVLEPYNSGNLGYLYETVFADEFILFATKHSYGSEQPVLSWTSAQKFNVLRPSNTIDKKYSEIVDSIIDSVLNNQIEIIKLTKQRDELLPLLMNGQATVNYHLSVLFLSSLILYRDQYKFYDMKETIIQAVLDGMRAVLTDNQLELLTDVTRKALSECEITPKLAEEEQRNKENAELLGAFISSKKVEGCSDKTIHYYKSSIEKLIATVKKNVCDISTNDIRCYLAEQQEQRGLSKVTIDNLRRIYSSFFSWLEDEDYITKSPVRRIHKVRTDALVKEVLTDENIEVLRDSCQELRDIAMIDLLLSTGMRVGELVKINREDIDFHERQCVVFGKGNKEREVYFNARTKIHLKKYLEQRTDTNPALFVSLHEPHTRLTISGVEVRLRQLGKKVNLNKVHPHKFRRTLATMAIDKGMPIEQVQKMLGHVKIDTTLHYAMVNQANVKIAHRKFLN